MQLKPSSKWLVDYKEGGCRLVREFGEGDDTTLLLFSRYDVTDRFQLTVAGMPVKTNSMSKEAELQFGPSEAKQEAFFHVGNLGKYDSMLFPSSLSIIAPDPADKGKKKDDDDYGFEPEIPIDPARLAAVRTFTIGSPLSRAVVFETGPLQKPFAALSTCITDLIASWGIDVEKHKHLKQPAQPVESPAKWISSKDYPTKMLAAGQPALVQFRLMIDVQGKVTSCHIQETTRPKDFDNAVCVKFMNRAKFTPALDADGTPIPSYYLNSISFRLPY